MTDYNSLKKASKDELIAIIEKLDSGLLEQNKHNRELVSDKLFTTKENKKLEDAYNKACEELAKAYKRHAKKPAEKWLKVENWKKKFIEGV